MHNSLELEKELAQFLRKKRGDLTFEQFSKRIGLTGATLCRLELAQQSITLRSLKLVMKRLDCTMADIFPSQFKR